MHYRVMVVEDEEIIAEVVRQALEHYGYDVVTLMTKGRGVLEKVEEHRPDLIIMDIMLQKGAANGIEIAEEINRHFSIPIVFLTGLCDDEYFERTRCVHPYGYILKPFRPQELRAAVELALSKSQAQKEMERSRNRLEQLFNERTLQLEKVTELLRCECAGRTIREIDIHNLAQVSSSVNALFAIATVKGKITCLNDNAMKRLGIEHDELERINMLDIFPEYARSRIMNEIIPSAFEKGDWEGELPYRNVKTDQVFHTFARLFAMRDLETGDPLCIADVSIDITEHRHIEDILRKNRDSFNTLLEESAYGVIIINTKGTVRFINNQASQMLIKSGIEAGELAGLITASSRDQEADVSLDEVCAGLSDLHIIRTIWEEEPALLILLPGSSPGGMGECQTRRLNLECMLARLSSHLVKGSDLKTAVEEGLREIRTVMSADRAFFLRRNDGASSFETVYENMADDASSIRHMLFDHPLEIPEKSDGTPGLPVIIDRASVSLLPEKWKKVFIQRKLTYLMVIPTRLMENCPGCLMVSFYSEDARRPDDEDLQMLHIASDMIAVTIGTFISEEKIRNSAQELLQLKSRIERVRTEERTFIAREIHDQLGQNLVCLKYEIASLRNRLSDEEPLREQLVSMTDLLDGTIAAVKRISSVLRPSILDEMSLEDAFQWQVLDFQKRTGIVCTCTVSCGTFVFGKKLSTVVFRILQETLTNIARHSGATRASVKMSIEGSMLVLSVRDNGTGISLKKLRNSLSCGIAGIKERVSQCGGVLKIKGRKGRGTVVTAEIPAYDDPAF